MKTKVYINQDSTITLWVGRYGIRVPWKKLLEAADHVYKDDPWRIETYIEVEE